MQFEKALYFKSASMSSVSRIDIGDVECEEAWSFDLETPERKALEG